MKKLTFILIVFIVFSCQEGNETTKNKEVLVQLKTFEEQEITETNTKKFIEDYVHDVNSTEWKSKISKYMQPYPEEFLKEHSAFRTSFQNYNSTIKHLTIAGNQGMVWLSVTANYSENYDFENSDYGDELFSGIEAKNQSLSWDEIWYFNVVDGKFGDQWDFIKDNHKIMKDLKVAETL
ncbi:hypothetical protein N9Y48_00670 [Zobellia sp.]|nr:hypothetical protein [Zobellia sp.]